ncbi:MAG: class I SAM-dependent RNA methyltransferase [Deltaproteobacteria bacterium]|nr:class I SAM-dependent RNA methyltransferase [Deltaproteobacteria bacterium]
MDSFHVVTAPGLEPFVALELERLGLVPEKHTAGIAPGRVAFYGGQGDLWCANLGLATADRVLAILGEFRAAAFSELRKKAARLPWERVFAPGGSVAIRVACHKSRLYHTGAVAERVAGAIADRLGEPPRLHEPQDDEGAGAAQTIFVRFESDACTIAADSSGELLHRRGYRLAVAKAPLRETLAAVMLLASGWDRASPLLDPFCGSGTIAIEAARMAEGIAPGRGRRFAFMDWPGFDRGRWESMIAGKATPAPGGTPIIMASDRDAGAIRMATANAERAGVADRIRFERLSVSDISPPRGQGWVVTNPPWGVRTDNGKDLRDLYARLGDVLRERCRGWNVAILSGDKRLLDRTRLDLDTSLALVNGGLRVRLARGVVPEV